MAVLPGSDNYSVSCDMQQNLEADDDDNKYAPSADCNSASARIFRNKKFTKKRHESKTRRTEEDDGINACCSDEDEPKGTRNRDRVEKDQLNHSIPKMMMTINQTIQKMSIKDSAMAQAQGLATGSRSVVGSSVGSSCAAPPPPLDPTMNGELLEKLEINPCNKSSSSCTVLPHPQGKRRRHRRKQQYKRMAVDVLNDKKSLQLKTPTSNSSEDSGIGKRKRNIILTDNNESGTSAGTIVVPVLVPNLSSSSKGAVHQQPWQLEDDAMMMDCDEMESSVATNTGPNQNSQRILVTEEESGESDTQNDDIESLSDPNLDADDEESDYYNNDSSTTSLSESSFTILNPSKKFIPVHSREIRSGRRRLKNTTINTIENGELLTFLQNSTDTVLKVYPGCEKEHRDFYNVASIYSLSFEEGCDPDEQRIWVQFTKTSKTTTPRRNDMIKPGDRSNFNNFLEGSTLTNFFDMCNPEHGEGDGKNDDCIDDSGDGRGSTLCRGGVGVNQLVNSKRIKKGT